MPQEKFLFKLGADPEFSFVMQERRVYASELLTKNLAGKEGFKKESQGYSCVGGQIGWDGCNATAELRPKPEFTPKAITENIRSILTLTHEKLPIFDMSVLSTFAPVGGHIHFQIPQEFHENRKKISMIHKKVSSFFLPIMASENKINLRLRTKRHNYGTLTDFHDDNAYKKADGSYEFTYEFRTPSAEWLTTPKICESTFAYLATVYNEILNNPTNFNKYLDVVYKNNDQAIALHQLAISDYIGITESIFTRIKKAIKTFELYPKYKDEIEYIFSTKKVVEDKKKANYNIVKGWGLDKGRIIKSPTIKDIVNEKKFKALAGKLDFDKLRGMMNISYNDDTNVELFVRNLVEKAFAFNWKINHKYFIFGLKKGIDTTFIFNQNKEIIRGKESIKTVTDKAAVLNLMDRIRSKIGGTSKSIDVMTGEVKTNETIIIGLPYDMRIKKKPNEFLKIIYNLERTKIKAESLEVNHKNLIDDRDNPENERGKLYRQIYGIEEKEPSVAIAEFDESESSNGASQGARIAEQNKYEILREIQRDEENNAEPEETVTGEELAMTPEMRSTINRLARPGESFLHEYVRIEEQTRQMGSNFTSTTINPALHSLSGSNPGMIRAEEALRATIEETAITEAIAEDGPSMEEMLDRAAETMDEEATNN